MAKKKATKKAKTPPKKGSKKKKAIRRGKSKLTLIRDNDAPKDESPEAFRPDKTIKQYLNELPRGEKSNFIVQAIYEKIAKTKQVTCPNCNGVGKIGPNIEIVRA